MPHGETVFLFCADCGKELPSGASFCPFCGAKVAVSSQQQQTYQPVTYMNAERKRPTGIIIISILAFLRIIVLLFIEIPGSIQQLDYGVVEFAQVSIMIDVFLILLYIPSIIGLLRLREWGRKMTIATVWLHPIMQYLHGIISSTIVNVDFLLDMSFIDINFIWAFIFPIIFTAYLTTSKVKAACQPVKNKYTRNY